MALPAGLPLQELVLLLARGLGIPQLELHLLADPQPFRHGNRARPWVNPDQVADQEGGLGGIAAGGQLEVAFRHPKEEGMTHQFPLSRGEGFQNALQAGHRCSLLLCGPEALNHVALRLVDFKNRPNGLAALGHHRVDPPGPFDQAPDGPIQHAVVQQQGAVVGAVLSSDASDLVGVGVGVVEPADQVIDGVAGGIDEQQHRVSIGWIDACPVRPVLAGSIEIGELIGLEPEHLDLRVREFQQGEADARLVFQFMGLALGVSAHHPTTAAADPVFACNGCAQQWQHPLQVAGIGAGAEHQG